MARSKWKEIEHHENLGLLLDGFSARTGASVSNEARGPRSPDYNTRVYNFCTEVELHALSAYPEKRAGTPYQLTLCGRERVRREFDLTAGDCQARDSNRRPVSKVVRGQHLPVFDIPKGIGLLNKTRGANEWNGFAWVSPTVTTDMLLLLGRNEPLYIALHEIRIGRVPRIEGLSHQTIDPAEE